MADFTDGDMPMLEPTGDPPREERRARRAYVELWPYRFGRLLKALETGDQNEALEAAVSLKTASEFVGAPVLSRKLRAVETALYRGSGNVVAELLLDVERCGAMTMQEMRRQTASGDGAEAATGSDHDPLA